MAKKWDPARILGRPTGRRLPEAAGRRDKDDFEDQNQPRFLKKLNMPVTMEI